jgi:hypothetical protein
MCDDGLRQGLERVPVRLRELKKFGIGSEPKRLVLKLVKF